MFHKESQQESQVNTKISQNDYTVLPKNNDSNCNHNFKKSQKLCL